VTATRSGACRSHRLSIGGRYAARANASGAHLSIGGRYAAATAMVDACYR
jgi:hypothetical protein